MPSPYVVGRWVCGSNHYDRESLIEYLLTARDTAIWVVGTRRMGKTSLLRQIEYLAQQSDSHFVPLFWDFQGSATAEDLTSELCWAIESETERFAELEIDIDLLCRRGDAAQLLRRLSRALSLRGRQLLLLVDEAEMLMDLADEEMHWLARLRRALQEGRLRTVLSSTRDLTQLSEQTAAWRTSPFLLGFHMVTLWPLDWEGASALVRQLQNAWQVEATDDLLEEILNCTNYHPYLIQLLCERIYCEEEDGRRYLRSIEPEDLAVNHELAFLFNSDYQSLQPMEQRLLLAVAAAGKATERELLAIVGAGQAGRLPDLLQSLQELGHLRSAAGRDQGEWIVGSEFLRRWLLPQLDELQRKLDDDVMAIGRIDESNIDAVARSLGISTERVRALGDMQIHSEEEFFNVVRSFFFEIRHLVEQDDGYRLLVTHGPSGELTLRSEDEIQIMFKHWLRPMCRALNIDLDREAMTGRGLLDFKFSIGHDFRCLVEVKLFQSNKLHDGVALQLPIYLQADRARYGLYVPIFLEHVDYAKQVEKLRKLAAQRAASHDLAIDVIDIRAWRPRSASKAGRIDDAERYQGKSLPNKGALDTLWPDTGISDDGSEDDSAHLKSGRSAGSTD